MLGHGGLPLEGCRGLGGVSVTSDLVFSGMIVAGRPVSLEGEEDGEEEESGYSVAGDEDGVNGLCHVGVFLALKTEVELLARPGVGIDGPLVGGVLARGPSRWRGH